MRKPKRQFVILLALFTFLIPLLSMTSESKADRVRPLRLKAWSLRTKALWRKEVRRREIARWYRCYQWTSLQRLWLKRRAEIVWITKFSLNSFTCRACCIYRWPDGRIWKIYRTFRTTDVVRFRKCYRIWWAGHLNPFLLDDRGRGMVNPAIAETLFQPLDLFDRRIRNRFCVTVDRVEVTLPMMPPNDQDVEIHEFNFPGQTTPDVIRPRGRDPFGNVELLPDMQELLQQGVDPHNAFQLATNQNILPADAQHLLDERDPLPPGPSGTPLVEIAPGVHVDWLMDDNGNVMSGLDPLDPQVLGNQQQVGLLDPPPDNPPQPGELVELPLPINMQLQCAVIDGATGRIMGARANQAMVIGPEAAPDPLDPLNNPAIMHPDSAMGGPLPMEPTDVDPSPQPQLQPVHTGLPPLEVALDLEGEPDQGQLDEHNALLQQAGFTPVFPPFSMCINSFKVKRWYGIDRRFVMDTWYHCWRWTLRHHIHLTKGMHRVWLFRKSVEALRYQRWCFVVGAVPTYFEVNQTNVRYLRLCYRIWCPRPNVVRLRLDQLFLVVPMPNGGLGMVTTEPDPTKWPAPAILAGLVDDPLENIGSSGQDGVSIQEIVDQQELAAQAQNMGAGTPGVFEAALVQINPGDNMDTRVIGNEDFQNAVMNNQLQLYCMVLDDNGLPAVDTFDTEILSMDLRTAPSPAIPVFAALPAPGDPVGTENGLLVGDPSDLSLELAIADDTDFNDDDITDYVDFAEFQSKWLKGILPLP